MDFSLYWFILPISVLIATTAMLSGIGGGALFMPLFLLVFPLLGPKYVLSEPTAAIAVALLTETFGFSSGFVAYYRKKLIDFKLSGSFLAISVPVAILGALCAHLVDPALIRFLYGLLVLIIAGILLRGHGVKNNKKKRPDDDSSFDRTIESSDGIRYRHNLYKARIFPTGVGGFLTGFLAAGIGEVVMPQLIKKGRVAVPVAAATSILVVIITVMSASFTHITTLISAGGLQAVPWNLVCYTIPGRHFRGALCAPG